MVPADSNDVHGEYKILINELKKYNPELLDKKRILAITKSDLVDHELMEDISKDLPQVPYVFISSVTMSNIGKLKDLLWRELTR
jgi:GTP-binding protein